MYAKCSSRRAGGVALYVTNHIISRETDALNIVSADSIHIELVLSNSISFSILGIYRLLYIQEFSEDVFVDELDNILCSVKSKNLIFAGDINLNILKLNRTSERYIIKMAGYGLESEITVPTRVTKDSETLIDHIFVRHGLGLDVSKKAWVSATDY